jgi:hypothetical protein
MSKEMIEIIQYERATAERLTREQPRGVSVVVISHPGGRWTGKKHYRVMSKSHAIAIEIASNDTVGGRRAAWLWLKMHNIKVGHRSYRQQ